MAALPDVIGSTIGNMIAGGIAESSRGAWERGEDLVHRSVRLDYSAQADPAAATEAYPGADSYEGDGTEETWEHVPSVAASEGDPAGDRAALSLIASDHVGLSQKGRRQLSLDLERLIAADKKGRGDAQNLARRPGEDWLFEGHGEFEGGVKDPDMTALRYLAAVGISDLPAGKLKGLGIAYQIEYLGGEDAPVARYEELAKFLIAESARTEPYGLQLRGARQGLARIAENNPNPEGYGRAIAILDKGIELNYQMLEQGINTQFRAFAREYGRIGGTVNPFVAVADLAVRMANNEVPPDQALAEILSMGRGPAANAGKKLLEEAVERAVKPDAAAERRRLGPNPDYGPPRAGLDTPQGLTPRLFDRLSSRVRAAIGAKGLGDDIILMGSRSGGTAKPNSDFDFGVRVSPERFDELVAQQFAGAKGAAKISTRDYSIRDGRIQTGEAGLRDVRRTIAQTLGVPEAKVQISVIRAGGWFDNGPQTRLSFGF